MKGIKKRGIFLVIAVMALVILPFSVYARMAEIEEINITFDKNIYVGDEPFTTVSATSTPEGAVKENIKVKWYEQSESDGCAFSKDDEKVPMTSDKFEAGKIYSFELDEDYLEEGYVEDEYTVINFNEASNSNYCIRPEVDDALPSPMNITIVNGMTAADFNFFFGIGMMMLEEEGEIITDDEENAGYSKTNKLLYTVDENGVVTIADNVTEEDDIHYEHTHRNGEKSYINLHFDPTGTLPTYEVIEGANSTYNSTKDTSLVFRIDADFDLFGDYSYIAIDGNIYFSDEGYQISEGSTVVTLNKELLDRLDEGEHTLAAFFSDGGKSVTKFNVSKTESATTPASNNPKTGDNMIMYLITGLASIVGLIFLIIFKKKQMN